MPNNTAMDIAKKFRPAYKRLAKMESRNKGMEKIGDFFWKMIENRREDERAERERKEREQSRVAAVQDAKDLAKHKVDLTLGAEAGKISGYQTQYGETAGGIKGIMNSIYAEDAIGNPNLQLSRLAEAQSLLGDIPEVAQKHVLSWSQADIQRQTDQIYETMRDDEKNNLRREVEQLKADAVTPAELRTMEMSANEAVAQQKIGEIGKLLEDAGPEEAGRLLLSAETQTPGIVGTKQWQGFIANLDKMGKLDVEKGAKGLLTSQQEITAQGIISDLYTPGGGNMFTMFKMTYKDSEGFKEIEKELDKVIFSEGVIEHRDVQGPFAGAPFAEELVTLVPPGASFEKAGYKKLQEFHSALEGTMALWAREGFDKNSPNSLLRAEVRSRLFNGVMSEEIETAKTTRKYFRESQDTAEPNDVIAYEDRLKKAAESIRGNAYDRAFVVANYQFYRGVYASLQLDIEDVFDEMGWKTYDAATE